MSEAEVNAVLSELETLMGALRSNVTALQDILTAPEVPGDQPERA